MQKIFTLLTFFTVTAAFGQVEVSASKIMSDIKAGKSISYQNVKVKGTLDFTYLEEKQGDLGSHRWWHGTNTVNEDIEVPISFVNCTFEGDVLAYIHIERSGYTFTADFEREVTFKNCYFKGDAMFKYSEFDRDVDFSGSKFNRKNTFKYAEFDDKADFSDTYFDDDAIFKYAEFDDGVSFNSAEFMESLDIKYLEVRGVFDIYRMEVRDDIDAKYTEINGKSFAKYLYQARSRN